VCVPAGAPPSPSGLCPAPISNQAPGLPFPRSSGTRRQLACIADSRHNASSPEASRELVVEEVTTVVQVWAGFLRRFRRRRVSATRQLLLGHTFGLVPETMSRNPAWQQPLRRALHAADVGLRQRRGA
jgi:hypothetical protein